MYNIDISRLKKNNIIHYFLLFVIIFMNSIMLYIIISSSITKYKMDSHTTSTRMEIESKKVDHRVYLNPTYYYEVNGVEYACKTNASSSSEPDSTSEIYYNSKNPKECISNYTTESNDLLIILCVMFSFGALIPISNHLKTRKRIKQISIAKERGKLIKGLDYKIGESSHQINSKVYKPIIVQYEINGDLREFESDIIHEVGEFDKYDKADLLIDESNPDNYYVGFNIDANENKRV